VPRSRRRSGSAAALAALLLLAAPWSGAWAQPLSFAPIVKAQRDKVVHIDTSVRGEPSAGGERFRLPEPDRGTGSGFILSADGFIVTNHHVVENADRVEVVLADERKFPAEIVGLDPQTDLALLKIDAGGLAAVRFGDSSRLEVGDWVIAIGNPLGLDHTVTAGIISAKERNIFDDENLAYGEFLQTDAAINPGNSGGPLFNLAGEVVGVNSAISRKGQGIGFAVPSNLVVQIVDQLQRFGRVQRGWLGVVIMELTRERAEQLVLPTGSRGVVIEEILPDSPAREAGLRKGDVLTRFGQESLSKVAQLQKLVALSLPGKDVELAGLRRDTDGAPWRPLRVKLRMGANPAGPETGSLSPLSRIGLSALNIPADIRRQSDLPGSAGVLVEAVAPGGPADEAGLRAGDVILEVNRTEVTSRAALETALLQARIPRIPLVVRRDRKVLYVTLQRDDLRR
jgi:serine protease Do